MVQMPLRCVRFYRHTDLSSISNETVTIFYEFLFSFFKKKKNPKNKKEANKTSCLQVFNNIFRNMLRKLR